MRSIILAAAAAALGLAGCQEGHGGGMNGGGGSVGGICKPFARDGASMAPVQLMGVEAVDDCLHRWGYTLAKSGDAADQVADAVVAACSAPLARWNQQSLGPGQPTEAPSILTGQPTNPMAEHANFAEGRALFYVVQARAGKCDVPRVSGRADNTAQANANVNANAAATDAATSPDR